MPFQMGSFMQMLPLLMAMGGGNPGGRMVGFQLKIVMLMIEIWIDYLASMQDFMERTLERLMEFSNGDSHDDDADDGDDW